MNQVRTGNKHTHISSTRTIGFDIDVGIVIHLPRVLYLSKYVNTGNGYGIPAFAPGPSINYN